MNVQTIRRGMVPVAIDGANLHVTIQIEGLVEAPDTKVASAAFDAAVESLLRQTAFAELIGNMSGITYVEGRGI